MNVLLDKIISYALILTPVWGFILWQKKIAGKKYFVLTIIMFLVGSVFTSFNFLGNYDMDYWLSGGRIPRYLNFYFFGGAAYLILLGPLYHWRHFNKALAVSLWLLFVAAEFWEIPIFVHDFLRKPPDVTWWMSQVRRVYAVAAFVLMVKLSGFKFNKVNLALLVIGVAIIFGLLPEYSPPRVNVDLAHAVALGVFGLVGWFGLDGNHRWNWLRSAKSEFR